MYADRDFIRERSEMMKSGVSWSDLAKLQSEHDRRVMEQERNEKVRKSQERKSEMDYYYRMKMERQKSEDDHNRRVLREKEQERQDIDKTNRNNWMDIKNKIDYRLDLAEKIGSRVGEYRNTNKDMPPAPDNMTLIYETEEQKQLRVLKEAKYQDNLKKQLEERRYETRIKKEMKLQEESAYLDAINQQLDFEKKEVQRRRHELIGNQKFLQKQMDEKKVRVSKEDQLTEREISYMRYSFVPSRPPYL